MNESWKKIQYVGISDRVVISPLRYSYEQVYVNILYLLDNADNSSDKIEDFIAALDADETGSVVFHIDNREQLFCFEPVCGRDNCMMRFMAGPLQRLLSRGQTTKRNIWG